jgi:hypothetical protein
MKNGTLKIVLMDPITRNQLTLKAACHPDPDSAAFLIVCATMYRSAWIDIDAEGKFVYVLTRLRLSARPVLPYSWAFGCLSFCDNVWYQSFFFGTLTKTVWGFVILMVQPDATLADCRHRSFAYNVPGFRFFAYRQALRAQFLPESAAAYFFWAG